MVLKMNLNKYSLLFSAVLSLFYLSGCSSSEIKVLSNGRPYLISDKCRTYKIMPNNEDVECYAKNNKYVGTIKPLSQEAIYILEQEKLREDLEWMWFAEEMQQVSNDFSNNLNKNRTTVSDDYYYPRPHRSFDFYNLGNQSLNSNYNIRQVGSTNNYMVNSEMHRVNQVGSDLHMVDSNMYRVTQEGSNRQRVTDLQNGTSTVYQTIGNVTRGSDGTRCIKFGNTYKCGY
jgi:hypothetical protein